MDQLISSMERAVASSPQDVALRLHLSSLLLDAGRSQEALAHAAQVLSGDPGNAAAQAIMATALAGGPDAKTGSASEAADGATPEAEFDWVAADAEMEELVEPRFVQNRRDDAYPTEIERPTLRLADVGGMKQVKERIEVSFLLPMRNPELRAAYGKSLRGGLLLYGPPGCGKTYLARAVAGELGASFLAVAVSDVLDMWVGSSERNLHDVFQAARVKAPCVLFLDEIDALGLKRSQSRNSGARNTVNQLLHELDGVENNNEGVFVLAATNHPWDVDEALRRPGRLDRMLAVLPPDEEAREAIFRHHLEQRPIAGIDPHALARRSEGLTGADIALVCEGAAERAMVDSIRSGNARLIEMADVEAMLVGTRPSAGPWLETARTVVEFANGDGQYDDLKAYLKKRRML